MKSIFYRVWDNEKQKYFEPTYEAFRGKLEDLHIGLHGDLFMRTMDGTIHCDSIFPGRFIIEQSAHKLDSKDRVIHVGDIVEVENGEDGPIITKCEWHEGGFALVDLAGGHWTRQLYHQPERLEVVGNIHQNADLL